MELDGTIAGVSIQLAQKSLEQEERGGLSVVRRVLLVTQLASLLLYGFDFMVNHACLSVSYQLFRLPNRLYSQLKGNSFLFLNSAWRRGFYLPIEETVIIYGWGKIGLSFNSGQQFTKKPSVE